MTTKAKILILIALAAPLMARPGANQPKHWRHYRRRPLSPIEQTIQDIKNPVPWLSWGGDIRVRNEYFNNALSLVRVPS